MKTVKRKTPLKKAQAGKSYYSRKSGRSISQKAAERRVSKGKGIIDYVYGGKDAPGTGTNKGEYIGFSKESRKSSGPFGVSMKDAKPGRAIKQKGGTSKLPKPMAPVKTPRINMVTPEKNPRKKPMNLMPVRPKKVLLAREGGVIKKPKMMAGGTIPKAQAGGAQGRIDKRIAKNEAKKRLDVVKGERKAIQTKAKEETRTIKAVNKNTRSKVEGYDSTKDKKEKTGEGVRKTIGALRSKEKNINVKGDRRLVGNNSTSTKIDNSVKTESTNLNNSSSATQKQKQNTGSNNKSSDNRRRDPRGPVPGRENELKRPSSPKEPIKTIDKNPRSIPPGMTRKQIEDIFKSGRYKTMQKGGSKPKAMYGKTVKPTMMKKGGVKKYQDAGETTTTTPAPAPKPTVASAMKANIAAGMKPGAAKRAAEKEVGTRKGVNSSDLVNAAGGVLGTAITAGVFNRNKNKLKGGVTKAMYGKSVKPGMMKKGGTKKK